MMQTNTPEPDMSLRTLLDAAEPSGMDGLPQRLPDLRRLATLLTGMAAGGA